MEPIKNYQRIYTSYPNSENLIPNKISTEIRPAYDLRYDILVLFKLGAFTKGSCDVCHWNWYFIQFWGPIYGFLQLFNNCKVIWNWQGVNLDITFCSFFLYFGPVSVSPQRAHNWVVEF